MLEISADNIFLAIANQHSSITGSDASANIVSFNTTILKSLTPPNYINSRLFQSIETKNAIYVNTFTINSKLYLGIGQSQDDDDGTNLNQFAIYEFDDDVGYFIPFQLISVPHATEISWANLFETDDGEWYLVLAPCYDEDATESGIYIYSWTGYEFFIFIFFIFVFFNYFCVHYR